MKNRRTASKIQPQHANGRRAGDPVAPRTTALLLTAVLLLAAQASASGNPALLPNAAILPADPYPAAQPSQLHDVLAAGNAAPAGAAKRGPQAKSKAEFDAYQSAAAEAEPAKLEAAAIEFAQRYPSSELRSFLFQRAMGLYQQRNDSAKALEMARAVLKYDPANAVALLGAAQLLVEGTHDHDLDRDGRLQEAAANAQLALQRAGELAQPAGVSAEQFESMIVELRGEAHEVLGTVAYKRRDYRTAIDEYNAAVAREKEHAGAVVWLRMAAVHDKLGEYSLGIAATEKALAASAKGSPVRAVAEKELVRLKARAAEAATRPAATPAATPAAAPAAAPGADPNANQAIPKTENARSPAAGE